MAKRKLEEGHSVGRTQIYKRYKKHWYIRYTDLEGKQVRFSLKVTNKVVAEKRALEISNLIESGDQDALALQTLPNDHRISYSSFLDYFQKTFNGWSETTRHRNGYQLEILREAFGDQMLHTITRRQLEGYLRDRQAAGMVKAKGKRRRDFTPATSNRYLATFKTMFKMAVEWGYLTRNPTEGIRQQKELKKPPRGLHEADAQRLIDAIDNELVRRLTIFAMDTGLRWSEIEALQWEEVDLRSATLHAGKKNYEARLIPLTARALQALEAMQTGRGGQIWPISGRATMVRKRLIKAAAKAEVGHISFHHLRHTFATRLLDKGVPLNDVQRLMGHKSPVMTQRYDAPHVDRLHRAITELETEETP